VAVTLLFGLGLLLGLALGPVLNDYADGRSLGALAGRRRHRGIRSGPRSGRLRDPPGPVVLVSPAVLGAPGPDRVRVVAIFVSIPSENIIWSVAGLVIFGGYTVLDFNRLRRSGQEEAVPIAASIFLDVLNIFLFFLQLFGGNNE
jgi:modulator of FtsH protease